MSTVWLKIWGSCERILETDNFVIDRLTLKKDTHSSYHYHNEKINFFYVISGHIQIREERGTIDLLPGNSMTVVPDYRHQFRVLEPSEILEVAWVKKGKITESDIVRLTQGGITLASGDVTEDELRNKGSYYEK